MSLGPWFVGNRDPSIQDVVRKSDGKTPEDLTGATVRFRAREIGSSALLVDQPVSNTLDATGVVRYDWSAADAATGALSAARHLLVWWQVTKSAKTQDVNEATIEVRAHGPLDAYVELEVFKETNTFGESYADDDIQVALVAASRGVEATWNRGRPYAPGSPGEIRYFGALDRKEVWVDPLIAVSAVALDYTGRDEYLVPLVENVDYRLEPIGADDLGRPFTKLRRIGSSQAFYSFPEYAAGVRITGTFGWPRVPEGVKMATGIIANRLVRRTREAPFGIVAFGLESAAIRAGAIARDPEVEFAMRAARAPKRLFV